MNKDGYRREKEMIYISWFHFCLWWRKKDKCIMPLYEKVVASQRVKYNKKNKSWNNTSMFWWESFKVLGFVDPRTLQSRFCWS